MPISKDRLAVFTNYPSVNKDQALEETILTGLFHPVVHGCFQVVGVTIDNITYRLPMLDAGRPSELYTLLSYNSLLF